MRLVFFDVDGTLSIPQYEAPDGRIVIGFPDEDWLRYCKTHGAASYEHCRIVPCTLRYAREQAARGARLFVLSTVMSAEEAEAKTEFIRRCCPSLFADCIYVREDAQKIHEICRAAEQLGAALPDCALVEDSYANLLRAAAAGIEPVHLSMLAERCGPDGPCGMQAAPAECNIKDQ
ncbi:hypothetical protein [Lachnoclostridium sp. Marseille-P6806]|uniref:hypothetical protein n=1 Tax=Lachnoclostridium sp. Marseille-P6806 TaxID=2364793 RepID=UPI0010326BDF|nr:hypothetical protein [Lachnoclostridium sp. Marseille-P6806]